MYIHVSLWEVHVYTIHTCTHLYSMLFQAPPLPPLCHLHYLEGPIMTTESNKHQLVPYIHV